MERDCLSEEHQILTENGFMFLKDLEKFSEEKRPLIASYDEQTKIIIYEKATELIIKDSKTQEMIEVNTDKLSFVVTPTHDIYYKMNNREYTKHKAKSLLEIGKYSQVEFMCVDNFGKLTKQVIYCDRDVKKITYTGRTWCVSVPHTFIITRRAYEIDGVVIKVSTPVIMGNCIIAHGASRFLKERLCEQSDPYTIMVCDICGNFATSATKCKGCNTDKISKVNMPYVSKLVIQELNAMMLKCKIEAKS